MPRQKHCYGLNHLHFLTRSTYRRARLFDSERFKRWWVQTLEGLRHELNFKIVGYVHGSNPVIAYMPKCGTYAPPAAWQGSTATNTRRSPDIALKYNPVNDTAIRTADAKIGCARYSLLSMDRIL